MRRQKILLVRLDHTGDCVMTVPPVVQALQQLASPPEIDVIASQTNCQLLSQVKGIRRRLPWDAPWSVPPFGSRSTPKVQYFVRVMKLFAKYPHLATRGYDATLFLSFNPWEKFLLQNSSSVRIGFQGPYQEKRHTDAERYLTKRVRFDESMHLLENCGVLLRAWASDASPLSPSCIPVEEAWSDAKWRGLPDRESLGKDAILIHPGHPKSFKSWPASQFVQLVHRLTRDEQRDVWIVASDLELSLQKELLDATEHPRCRRLACGSLAEFAGLAKRVGLVVANDGGPAHIAAAIGVPTIVLFGPTDERLYAPLGTHVRCIRNIEIKSAPCQTPWRKAEACCQRGECLSKLSVEQVAHSIHQLLDPSLKSD